MFAARPKARKEGLLVRDLGDEVVVYEIASHRSHCLNRPAALVWRACDGRRTTAAIAAHVGRALGASPDEDVVRYALRRLGEAGLLDPAPTAAATLTRRELACRVGRAALLPVVASLLVPRPAEAASCAASCGVCDCTGQADFTSCSTDGATCPGNFCCKGVCVPPASVCN